MSTQPPGAPPQSLRGGVLGLGGAEKLGGGKSEKRGGKIRWGWRLWLSLIWPMQGGGGGWHRGRGCGIPDQKQSLHVRSPMKRKGIKNTQIGFRGKR